MARATLWLERATGPLLPVLGLVGLFLTLALLDVLPALPGWLHALVLLVFAVLLGLALWRGLGSLRLPDPTEADRRLEQDSGFDHRPLTGLTDLQASGLEDEAARSLWERHRTRLLSRLQGLRLKTPRPGAAAADPYALRALVVLLLVVGAVVGWRDFGQRVASAFTPGFASAAAQPPPSLDLWLSPPAYTARPPLLLAEAEPDRAVPVPIGSRLLGRVQGGRQTPVLTLDEAVAAEFEPVGERAYQLETELEAGQRIAVLQGETELAAWPIEVVPDQPPTVAFLEPPRRTERLSLVLTYEAADDYGLERLGAEVRRADKPGADPIELEVLLQRQGLREANGLSYHELTAHPWAGLPVKIVLEAEDALGQLGRSGEVSTVLPERIFNHPVARRLVEMRKQLTLKPEARLPIVRGLADLYSRPDHYFNDISVALALRLAERRLIHDRTREAIPSVQGLMWETALYLEEGELSVAERELRELQEALEKALAEGASDEEIARLMDELEKAIDRFLEAMMRELQERMARGEETEETPPGSEMLERMDLQQMLEEARRLAESGMREQAMDMLSQLRQMLENLRASTFSELAEQQARQAGEMMRQLEELAKRQQDMLDRTFRRSQEGDQGQQGEQGDQQSQRQSRPGEGEAGRQEQLRRDLGELMRRLADALGTMPQELGRAEQSMRESRDALQQNQPGQALEPQGRALDQLQQGMQSLAETLMERFGQAPGQGQGEVGLDPGQDGRDPLGRDPGNNGLHARDGVDIPDGGELQRAREILNELRRRRSDGTRPPLELDYLDRLLDRF